MQLTSDKSSAATEWRAHWPLTLAAMVGVSTIGLQSYGFSAFAGPIEKAFGWTRAETMFGVTIAMALGIFLNMIVGLIVDRFGSRRVGIAGLFAMSGAFALLSTATGEHANWWLLWVVIAIGVVLVQSTVWLGPVAARFDKSRGLAMAVALSGAPLAAMIMPKLSTWLIPELGWRQAMMALGGLWLVVTLPIILIWFRDPPERTTTVADGPALSGLTFAQGIKTRAFAGLVISFAAFSFYNMTIATNLMLMLGEKGIAPAQAGSLFAVMGTVGLVARLSVGFLLDRFPAHIIGTFTQLLPVFASIILLTVSPTTAALLTVVALFGLATGAEIDVVMYQATRHFGLKAFGALFSGIITFGALFAAIGPWVAGRLHDLTGNYDFLLLTVIGLMVVGALGMLMTGQAKQNWAATE
jgi:nitrate/nitrite transporter NarK